MDFEVLIDLGDANISLVRYNSCASQYKDANNRPR